MKKSKVLDKIRDILSREEFKEYANNVYVCGGAVRDFIMNPDLKPKDIDLVVDSPNGGILFAEKICKYLNVYKEDSNPVIYNRFNTCKFIIDGEDLEAVCPRKEEYTQNSRKPSVRACTLEEDALRRDFTINALYYNVSTGDIIDFCGGENDIHNNVLRTPLDPYETFTDDPLRMLRAFRFFARFEKFELSDDIINAIRKCHERLHIISRERIMDEMIKILSVDSSKKLAEVLDIMMDTGILDIIFKDIKEIRFLKQGLSHTHRTVWAHTLNAIKLSPCDYKVRLSLLLHDIGKKDTMEYYDEDKILFPKHDIKGAELAESLLKYNKFCNNDISEISTAIMMHMRLSNIFFSHFMLDRNRFNDEREYNNAINFCKGIVDSCGKYLNTCFSVFSCDVQSLDDEKRKIKDKHIKQTKSIIDKIVNCDTYLKNNKLYLSGYDIMEKYPNIAKTDIKNMLSAENFKIFLEHFKTV